MKNRVKELRDAKHLTQTGLALKIGSTQQTISKIESKRSIASTLKKLRTAVIGGSWLLLFSNPFWKFFRPW